MSEKSITFAAGIVNYSFMKKLFVCAFAAFSMLSCSFLTNDLNLDDLTPGEPVAQDGVLPGRFSVSSSKQVQFAQGNLQFQASTNTWRFAEHQYDLLGDANKNISSTNSEWIDLFGWGTGNNPTLTSTEAADYATFVDWGKNPISNAGKQAYLWRTLSADEWTYLLIDRPNASSLFVLATVHNVKGLILLPDGWSAPDGVSLVNPMSKGMEKMDGYYSWENVMHAFFDDNVFSGSKWRKLEEAGAVFFPLAGDRNGTNVFNVNSYGVYASSTPRNDFGQKVFDIGGVGVRPHGSADKTMGVSIRLVR